jgi:hypothetical protein
MTQQEIAAHASRIVQARIAGNAPVQSLEVYGVGVEYTPRHAR